MPRLALALLAVTVAIVLIAYLMRSVTRQIEQKGGLTAMTTGGMMQKVAFFMLLCLIVYVSVSGV
jgi:hypothetical protein